MSKLLIVVDMQNDFIAGSLGSPQAKDIIPNVNKKIKKYLKQGGLTIYTVDRHDGNYLNTQEGKKLPVKHCIFGTDGYKIHEDVIIKDYYKIITKESFGSLELVEYIKNNFTNLESIELVGLCTDVCVISNAIILRNAFPNVEIFVDPSCCAGTSPDNHKTALDAMKLVQINVDTPKVEIEKDDIKSLESSVMKIVEKHYLHLWTPKNIDKLIVDMTIKLKRYQEEKLKSNPYVIGLSGGLDSALVYCLCKKYDIDVKAYYINIESSASSRDFVNKLSKEFDDGKMYYENLNDDFKFLRERCIQKDPVSLGNLKARLRMILLYDRARYHGGCVLSTDNLSELQMGFWTLHGDVGDIAPIQYLNKGFEIPYIARHIGIPNDIIDQAPSDDLGVTKENTDEAQLGANYKFVDTVMFVYNALRSSSDFHDKLYIDEHKELFETFLNESSLAKKIVARYKNSEFKRTPSGLFKYRDDDCFDLNIYVS